MDDLIKQHYDRWLYPEPMDDIEQHIKDNGIAPDDPSQIHLSYWPCGKPQDALDILVVGCGAVQAPYTAFCNPKAQVLGIDLSDAGLKQCQRLKEKHGLDNLELRHFDLNQAAHLEQTFDLILARGVLQHLSSPVDSVKALMSVLRPDGVLDINIYGKYLRQGVDMLQQLFQSLGMEATAEDVTAVRQTIQVLSDNHPLQTYLRSQEALGLHSASGIADTFLHPHDKTYTVMDCLDLLSDAGLCFQGWNDNIYYYPDGLVSSTHTIFKKIEALPKESVWSCTELLHGQLGVHHFFACHPERNKKDYEIDFSRDDFLQFIPVLKHNRIELTQQPSAENNHVSKFKRGSHTETALNLYQATLFNHFSDGDKTIEQALKEAKLPLSDEDSAIFARDFLQSLWCMGHIWIKLPKTGSAL